MRTRFLTAAAAALIVSLGAAAPAPAKTVVAPAANAGGTAAVADRHTPAGQLPGSW